MEHLACVEQHSRGLRYRRNVRRKQIRRKKKICNAHGFDWYKFDGCYSKGKIHCSCPLCTYSKYYDYPRLKDCIDADKVKEQLKEVKNY